MEIVVTDPGLVLLVGIAGSGKSTFAARHFAPTEVLSSDAFRALVADDPRDQSATPDAFHALHHVLALRLRRGRTTIIDATNLLAEDRQPLLDAARTFGVPATAAVLDLPLEVCLARARERPDRRVAPRIVREQHTLLRFGLAEMATEPVEVHRLTSVAEVDGAVVVRRPAAG